MHKRKRNLYKQPKPYVTKTMRTAIIKRSETATKFRNGPSKLNKKVFKKQRNFYTKRKKIKYGNLDLKKMIDNREF